MVEQVARIDVAPTHRPVAERSDDDLGPGWVTLGECRLRPSDRGNPPTVLMHPARGIAVIDILPSRTPHAVDALRARLHAARFPAIFAGELPVVHLRVTAHQMPFLPTLLAEAFAVQPRIHLPGGDAWVGVAARVLTGEQPVPRLPSRRVRSATTTRPGWRRAAASLRRVGAVLVCLAALGGVLAMVVREEPAPSPVEVPEATPVPAPLAAAAVPPAPPLMTEEPASADGVLPTPAPAPEFALAPPAAPALGEAEAVGPLPPEAPPLAPAPLPAENLPAPLPQRPAPPRRSEAVAPSTRKPPERTASRRQQEAVAASQPERSAPPEAAPDRCRRVSALVGSGAPLGEADMRFFNESCIRW